MPRNLDRRIEVVAPVYDPDIKADLMRTVDYGLRDNINASVVDGSGRNELRVTAGEKNEDARMLKIAVDDPGYLYVVSYAGHCCHKRAVAADEHVYPYAGRGGLVEFFHHLFVGDMVYLYLDPGLFPLAGSPDLVIDESNKAFEIGREHV